MQVMQDSIVLVLTFSGIMRPISLPSLDHERGRIGSTHHLLITIRSRYIRLRTSFDEVLVLLKAIILLSIRMRVSPKLAVIRKVSRLFFVSVLAFLS